jgi:hypothetical protein
MMMQSKGEDPLLLILSLDPIIMPLMMMMMMMMMQSKEGAFRCLV